MRKYAKNPHPKILSACWDMIKRSSAKKCFGRPRGALKNDLLARADVRDVVISRVMLTLVSDTITLSWLIIIMWCLSTTSTESWTKTFLFLSINVLLLFSAWIFLKREVRGYLREAASFLYRERVWDEDRQGRRRSFDFFFGVSSRGVQPSFVVMTLRVQHCDNFFFSLFSLL